MAFAMQGTGNMSSMGSSGSGLPPSQTQVGPNLEEIQTEVR